MGTIVLRVNRDGTIITLLLALLCPLLAEAQAATTPSSHVRATNPRIAAGLQRGLTLSSTMVKLVVELDAAPVIVYLRDGGCPGRAEACLMVGATTEGIRYLHVNFRLSDSRPYRYLDFNDRLVAQIAHELQHAVEVARDPTIVDGSTLALAYSKRAGVRLNGELTFETPEALLVGESVLRDIRRPTHVARTVPHGSGTTQPAAALRRD